MRHIAESEFTLSDIENVVGKGFLMDGNFCRTPHGRLNVAAQRVDQGLEVLVLPLKMVGLQKRPSLQ